MDSVQVTAKDGSVSSVKGSDQERRLREFYAANFESASRLAYVLTGDEYLSQDIVQEAFVRVGGRLASLRDPDRAVGYLYRTIANLAKGHGRSHQRFQRLRHRFGEHDAVSPPETEVRDELVTALLKLSLRHRTVLFLRYYLDLSEMEVARLLGVSVSATKSLTHRAVSAIRKELGGSGDER